MDRTIHRLVLASLALLGALAFAGCGGGGGGGAPRVSAANSSVVADVPFGTPPDGVSVVTITVTVLDTAGRPFANQTVQLAATGSGNALTQPAATTDANGVATGTLTSTALEAKVVTATVNPGPDQVVLLQSATVQFFRAPPGSRYVRASGNDANGGTGPLDAWRTIARALMALQPGETLFVGAGTYMETVTTSLVATATDPTVFHADFEGCFTGDAGPVVLDAVGMGSAFHADGARYLVVRGFEVTGAAAAAAGIRVDNGAQNVDLVWNAVYGNDLGIGVELCADVLLEGNRVSLQTGDGVALGGSDRVEVDGNLIYANGGRGVRVSGLCDDVAIRLNTLYQNAGDQVLLENGLTNGVVSDNIVAEGGAVGIHVGLGAAASEDHDLLWTNATDFVDDNGGMMGANTLVGNPRFSDADGPDNLLGGAQGADDDLRLNANSPALDAGSGTANGIVLRYGGPLAHQVSRSSGLLDGEDPDGEPSNIGFHYPTAVDAFASLADGTARLAFGTDGNARVATRARGLGGAWSALVQPALAGATVRWVVHRVSPLLQRDEVLAVLSDDGAATRFFVLHWDGRKWQRDDPADPITSAIQSANSTLQGFDLAFEQTSGDALLVRSDDTSVPVYRTLVDGVWSSDMPVLGAPLGAGTVVWVRLVARPGTDEIALVTLDDAQNLVAVVWDGSSWVGASATLLDTSAATVTMARCFDAAYESLSGDLLVAWGFTTGSEETRYAEKAAGSNVFVVQQQGSTEATGAIFRLASEPGSDRIVAGIGEAGLGPAEDDIVAAVWGGAGYVDIVELDNAAVGNLRDLCVAWVGATGEALLLYADDLQPLDWGLYTPSGWRDESPAALPNTGGFRFGRMCPIPGEDRVAVLLVNSAGELYELVYEDGPMAISGTWSLGNGGTPLGTNVPLAGPAEAFDFEFKPD